jgi:hypothetical protein
MSMRISIDKVVGDVVEGGRSSAEPVTPREAEADESTLPEARMEEIERGLRIRATRQARRFAD